MTTRERDSSKPGEQRVLLIGPQAPPYGGVALQAQSLRELMTQEGTAITFLAANLPFPGPLRFLEKLRGARPFLRSILFCGRLWKTLPRVDVVHILACSWLYFFLVVGPAVILSRMRGKRVVLNYRGGEAKRFFRWWGWIARPVFQLANVVTVPSNFLAEVIRNCFGVPVVIVPNILDLSLFKYRARTALRPKMLVTRHLEKLYDIESVLKAFRTVQSHYPEASLWIAGTGSQEQHLRSLVAEWNLRNVRFGGHVDHRGLAEIYDQCDILLNASRADNFPGALLEASAAGLAVVSTNPGGIPYIYENEKSALLVEPGDSVGLAVAVEKLLREPSLARDLTTRAATLAGECDWKKVRRQLYEAYGFFVEEIHEELAGALQAAHLGSREF